MEELKNRKQKLVKINFPNKLSDQKMKPNLHTIHQNNKNNNNNNSIYLYYKNKKHKKYKIDEQAITNITQRHFKHTEHQKEIILIIYSTKFKILYLYKLFVLKINNQT